MSANTSPEGGAIGVFVYGLLIALAVIGFTRPDLLPMAFGFLFGGLLFGWLISALSSR